MSNLSWMLTSLLPLSMFVFMLFVISLVYDA